MTRLAPKLAAIAIVWTAFAACPEARAQSQTLFTSETPALVGLTDGPSAGYELGLHFVADVAGQVTAIRFWKDANESAAHTGRVWSAGGGLLASVAFSGESGSGWQQQVLSTPVPIAAGADYVVTVNTGNTYYVVTSGGLSAPIVNQHLRSVAGNDGVFGPIGQFPTSSYHGGNYFRDVVFAPGLGRTVSGSITPGASGAGATVTLTGPTGAVAIADASGNFSLASIPDGSYTLVATKSGFRFSPPGQTIAVSGAPVSGVSFAATATESLFKTQAPAMRGLSDGAGVNYDLGLRFTSAVPGEILALRFWKDASESGTHTGRLWSAGGTLLASVAFQGETSAGWQEQSLPAPVPIVANAVYVATVDTGGTYYVATGAGLAQQVANQDLLSVVGSNGVFGPPGQFPMSSYNGTNYFRDVAMVVDGSPRYAISGSIAAAPDGAGATVTLGGDTLLTTTADASGRYAFTGLPSGNYTVTPAKSGFQMAPATRAVTVSGAAASAVDFTTQLYQTLFTTQVPAALHGNDGVPYEFGTRFTSDIAGAVAAIRFWKDANESGTHVGRLWTGGGTLLATVTFAGETASGWQQQALPSPQPIIAGATYVVTVGTSNNVYVATGGGLSQQVANPPLRSVVGNNGVYGWIGQFPTSSYQGGSYFRDIVLVGDPSPRFAVSGSVSPANFGSGGTVTLSGAVDLATAIDGSGNFNFAGIPNGTYTLTPSRSGYGFSPASRTITVNGADAVAPAFGATQLPPRETIFTTQTPAVTAGDGPYELGVRFYSVSNGRITAIRFWKSPGESGAHVGRLWSASGDLLASVTFQGETASGWQEQALSGPVEIKSNTMYVASVSTANLYGATLGGLAQQVSNGDLRTVVGGNGVFGAAGQFPRQSWQNTDYFRDVVFVGEPLPLPTGYRITGSVGPAALGNGATIALGGAAAASVVVDPAGGFIFSGLANGTYTMTPSRQGFTFAPPAQTLTVNGADVAGVAFVAGAANPIVAENANPGSSAWQLLNPALGDEINGYAGAASVNKGQSVTLFVNSTGSPYTLDVYRLGWYGGLGGRLMVSAGTRPAQAQTIPSPDPDYGMTECHWTPSYTVNTSSSWTTGVYVARVARTSDGKDNHIFFVVRDDASASSVFVQSSVTTVQAYDNWGGKCLYRDRCTDFSALTQSISAQSVKVSFDRPLTTFDPSQPPSAIGTTDNFLRWEYPLVRWLESQGYDAAYCTAVDTHANGAAILQHRLWMSVGQDEYWSSAMRDHVEAARAAGVNLAFFSANDCYWQVRFEPSSSGVANRVMVGFKQSAETFDPFVGDPSLSTTRFRDPFVNRPENALSGVMYAGDTVSHNGFPFVVGNAQYPFFRNTGLGNGSSLPGIVGYEWDNVAGYPYDNLPGSAPRNEILLSDSPATTNEPENSAGDPISPASSSNAVVCQTAGGALVFAAGTVQWSWGLDNFNTPVNAMDPRVKQITANVISDLGAAPATPSPALVLTRSFSISGSTTPSLAGATVTVAGPGGTRTTTTDAQGRFVVKVLLDGTYAVTPSKAGTTFSPPSATVVVSGADASAAAFGHSP